MAGMVTGGILDIILTPVFLFVLNLGVKGAALAAIYRTGSGSDGTGRLFLAWQNETEWKETK